MQSVTIYRWKFKVWCIFFILLQVLTLGLLMFPATVLPWISISSAHSKVYKADTLDHTYSSDDYFDPSSFTGNLLFCISGCSNSYSQESTDWCSIYNYYNNPESPNENISNYNSLCKMFANLDSAGSLYSIFLSGAIIGIFFSTCTLCNNYNKKCCLCLNYCCPIFTLISLFVAFTGWSGLSLVSYTEKCNNFPTNGSIPQVCALAGGKTTIGVLIILFCFTVFYISFLCKVIKKAYRNPQRNNRNSGQDLVVAVELPANVVDQNLPSVPAFGIPDIYQFGYFSQDLPYAKPEIISSNKQEIYLPPSANNYKRNFLRNGLDQTEKENKNVCVHEEKESFDKINEEKDKE